MGKYVLLPSEYFSVFFTSSSQAVICQSAWLQQPVYEAEQRIDGICWLCGELAGGTESLVADLMTRGGSNPHAQPFSVSRRWLTQCMAVYSSGVWSLERSQCGGTELSNVRATCALHSVSGPLSPPDGPPTWAPTIGPGTCSGCLNGFQDQQLWYLCSCSRSLSRIDCKPV